MCRKRAERRGRVQARREQETRQGAVASNGHGTAKLSAGLASGWAPSASTPGRRHSEAPGRRPPIRPGASCEALRATGGASLTADHPADSGQGRAGRQGPGALALCPPASGCSPVGAVAGASPLHRSLCQAGRRLRVGRRRSRRPAVQIGANKARGTPPGHRAGSLLPAAAEPACAAHGNSRSASAGGRNPPTRPVGPEKTHSTIVEADGMLRVQA
jgi:hypothetical protein